MDIFYQYEKETTKIMSNPFITPPTKHSRVYDYFYCHDCDTVIRVPIGVTDKTEIQCPICNKPAKIGTINRKKLYIDLYKTGKTPSEIAEKTGVTEQTVRNNIIKYFMETDDELDISRLITDNTHIDEINNILSTKHFIPPLSDIRSELQIKYKVDCNYNTIATVRAMHAKATGQHLK